MRARTDEELESLPVIYQSFDASKDDINDLELPDVLDGFVYCPGSINLRPFKSLKMSDFERDMQINYFSMIKILQVLLPKLNKSESASIVLFSTVAAQTGMPFHTSISAAKCAIEGFARSLASELAPKIRVNVVAPSLTDTPLASRIVGNDKARSNISSKHPLKRIGEAQDIANVVSFLLSGKTSWITGQVLHVDGGMSTIKL